MRVATLFILIVLVSSCASPKEEPDDFLANRSRIECEGSICSGEYIGPEYYESEDIAHQFSNLIADSVSAILKRRYERGAYSRVSFNNIVMRTSGMGTGNVTYQILIPLERVYEECEAKTAFDHSGGWGHSPDLKRRKKELSTALLPNDKLDISPLKITSEGLQEYWIQWRHKEVQKECE
ncbi:MAG: hypothetical protein Crog4KO_24730 [Crocinitomicaceae bacterium]